MRDPIKVVHLMRTYGVRGGEQQVSQFFMISQHSRLDQSFVSLFRDKKCAELLKKRTPSLKYSTLSQKSPIQRKVSLGRTVSITYSLFLSCSQI